MVVGCIANVWIVREIHKGMYKRNETKPKRNDNNGEQHWSRAQAQAMCSVHFY